MSLAPDTLDDERLADLRRFVMRELERGRTAGADGADLVAVLTHALGEVLGATGRPDIGPILPVIAAQVLANHRRALQRRATTAPALAASRAAS